MSMSNILQLLKHPKSGSDQIETVVSYAPSESVWGLDSGVEPGRSSPAYLHVICLSIRQNSPRSMICRTPQTQFRFLVVRAALWLSRSAGQSRIRH